MTHCQIDSLICRNGRVFGWGWCVDPAGVPQSITLELEGDAGAATVHAIAGGQRDDVAAALPNIAHARHSGFLIIGESPAFDAPILSGNAIVIDNNGARHEFPIAASLLGGPLNVGTARRFGGRVFAFLKRSGMAGVVRVMRSHWAQAIATGLRIPARVALMLARRPVHLILDHDLGGGANKYARELIAALTSRGGTVVRMVPVLSDLQYRCEFHRSGWSAAWEGDAPLALLNRILPNRPLDIHINSLVSFGQQSAVLRWMVERAERGSSITLHVHDFHSVCPSWTLIDSTDRFCGIPEDLSICARCLPANTRNTLGYTGLGIADWRTVWQAVLERARIIVFSESSRALLRRAYPWLESANIELRPHSTDTHRMRTIAYCARASSPLVVGVPGHINVPKGAQMLKDMAAIAKREQLPVRFVVFGTLERSEPGDGIEVLGQYQPAQLPGLFETHGVGVGFLPSICSETFSYVTAEMMGMGIPVAVFPRGAPAERVATYARGHVLSTLDPAVAVRELVAFGLSTPQQPHDPTDTTATQALH